MALRLAAALVRGPWRSEDLVDRGYLALGRRRRWLPGLVSRLVAEFGTGGRPTSGRVAAFVREDAGFLRADRRDTIAIEWGGPLDPPPVMWPAPGPPSTWDLPPITIPTALADRLGVSLRELEWLADRQARERRLSSGDPRRYSYRWVAKRSGGARLVEVPGPRLRTVQRRILRDLLDAIPPHDAAHGFRRGRSVRSYVSPHVGRSVVLKMDLRDFFPAITAARVTALFLEAGYPEPVARLLAGLGTNSAPSSSWNQAGAPVRSSETRRARRLLQWPHLPQGASTSPALANLCAYRLDLRLTGLARSAGGAYTRYADDLAFSGGDDFARSVDRFWVHACAIALEEGFEVNARKTRIMRRGVRQRVAGVVINTTPNVSREEYDTLKATLYNCLKHGPNGQNRHGLADFRAHLLGKVAHVGSLHLDRGRRLRAMFDRIAWRDPEPS